MPTAESHPQDGQEMTVVPDAGPPARSHPGPQHVRLHEVPTFAWITACAFSPTLGPPWFRYILAVLAWPVAMFIPLATGLKSLYRTDDFTGVVIMEEKKGRATRMAVRCTLTFIVITCLPLLLMLPGIPGEVYAWIGTALPVIAEVVVVWVAMGMIVILISGPLEVRKERHEALKSGKEVQPKLAPKGTPMVDLDGETVKISGLGKRIKKDLGSGATFRLVHTLISGRPEGSFVVVEPRTGSLRASYARRRFVASGRKEMVLRAPGKKGD